jgi:tRNA threonylcarbamoyladenosine biosynthesis protein TsaB
MPSIAFDTATDVATSALVEGETVLGERVSVPRSLLADLDALLADAGVEPSSLDGLVVGTGPGSFTSTRIGLAVARGLALALELPVAGVSTLDALAAAHEGAYPVIDARRREVFVPGPRAVSPDELELEPEAVATLLDLARIAAHESGKRTNAPLLCYLVGRATASGAPLDAVAAALRRD